MVTLLTAFGIILKNRTKILEIELAHKKEIEKLEFTESSLIRNELQIGLERSREDIANLRREVDEWQFKFYELEKKQVKEIFDLRTEFQGNLLKAIS